MGKSPLRDRIKKDYEAFAADTGDKFGSFGNDVSADFESFGNDVSAEFAANNDEITAQYDATKQQVKDDHAAYEQYSETAYEQFVEHANGGATLEVQTIEANTGGSLDFDPYYWGQAEQLGLKGDFTMPSSNSDASIICADNGVAVLLHDSVPMSGVVDEKGNLGFYAMMQDGQIAKMNDPHIEEAVISANKEYGNPESAFSKALAKRDQQKAVMNQMLNNAMSR